MGFLDLSHERFSVLEYEHRPIERDVIDRILEAGIAAPTACNYQPQRILIIDDDAGRAKINRIVPIRYYIPAAFLVCYSKSACWVRPMDGKSSGEIDASIVTTHMMMEATDLGLGSIWVMNWDPKKMKREFKLSDDLEPVALLIVGHKSKNAAPHQGHLSRKSIEEILI